MNENIDRINAQVRDIFSGNSIVEAIVVRPPGGLPPRQPPVAPPQGRPDMPEMNDRLAKLEGTVEGMEGQITAVMWMVGIAITLVLGVFTYSVTQFNRLDTAIAGVPDKVNANIRDLTNTLAQTIIAARQTPPQVVLMPQPQVVQPAPVPLPPNQPGR